jgi:hypothetical protein
MKLNRGTDVARQGECHILGEESPIIQGAEQSSGIRIAALMANFIYGAKWRPYASPIRLGTIRMVRNRK